MEKEIAQAIIKKCQEIFGRDDITEDTRFIDDLKAKSMNIVQIATMLEDMYDIEVQYMKLRRYPTVGEAAGFIVTLLEQ